MKAVFYHKPGSIYKDDPARCYHFPHQYLSRVEQTLGDMIIYYGPKSTKGRGYWAVGTVTAIREDPATARHYYAEISHYIDFDRLVPYSENGGYERKLFSSDGSMNGGRAVQAVRLIEADEFAAIVQAGLSQADPWPDRYDSLTDRPFDPASMPGFGEQPQMNLERPVVQQLANRKFRSAKFRQNIISIYDRTCALTGLRLINGHGRPEVEAAHIVPVEHNGPDSVRNGIALSGTVHWMFDRGLLSLADDFTILKSRHLNHDVSHLLRSDMKAVVPSDTGLQPHPHYLEWHRAHCFKQ